ncbi:unnamed protein product [Owenia fusiformis]|uniref:Uncharacterized protein n=1 Tax=Owenia fusiformis TaxID=6347 RepID=A0A8S4P764_OWEFU|nr:unnamed protein product [Owenia fusiformis]
MMKIVGILVVCFITDVVPAESDYSNYYDEIAQASCTAMNSAGGWMYAVRRDCYGDGYRTCEVICQNPHMKKYDPQVAQRRMICINSLRVYENRPQFAHGTGYGKLGLKTYRYNTCIRKGCGPNYCCCRTF